MERDVTGWLHKAETVPNLVAGLAFSIALNYLNRVVRGRNQKAKPPAISCTRVDDGEVVVTYGSKRKLCALARGIIRGAAEHYGDEVEIREETCMLRGDKLCVIGVRLVRRALASA